MRQLGPSESRKTLLPREDDDDTSTINSDSLIDPPTYNESAFEGTEDEADSESESVVEEVKDMAQPETSVAESASYVEQFQAQLLADANDSRIVPNDHSKDMSCSFQEEKTVTPYNYTRVICIPFFRNEMLFLPIVPGKHEYQLEEEDAVPAGCVGRTKKSWKDRVRRWGHHKSNSFKFKLHNLARRRTEEESALEKFFKRLPTGTSGFTMEHSATLHSEIILTQIVMAFQKRQKKNFKRVVFFGVLLPFAMLIDLITFVFVLTIADLTALAVSTGAFIDSQSLMNLVDSGRITFAPNQALALYDIDRYKHKDGIPSDEDIEVLCATLGLPGMAKTVKKVRNRQLRKLGIRRIPTHHNDRFSQIQSLAAAPQPIPDQLKVPSAPFEY